MSNKHRHEHSADHGSGMKAAANQSMGEASEAAIVETPPVAETVTTEAPAAVSAEATAPAAAPVAATPSTKDGAKVLLADGTPRIDYIRKRWAEGATRSVITKEVNEKRVANTEPVPYQIIFAATKGLAKPAAAETPAASEGNGEAVTEAPAEAAA